MVGPNDWQPIATGTVGRVVGDSPNTITYPGDNGLMVKLSPFDTQDMIEDHSGDGDTVGQNVSHRFEELQGRTLSFDWTARGKWIERFIWKVFDDPTKRPFEVRERFVDVTEAMAAINNAGGYAALYEGALAADGAGLADMVVEDLVTLDAGATIYEVAAVTAASLTVDRPLVAAIDDNDVIARASIEKSIQAEYYVAKPGLLREAKGVQGQTVELTPTGEFTRTGLGS